MNIENEEFNDTHEEEMEDLGEHDTSHQMDDVGMESMKIEEDEMVEEGMKIEDDFGEQAGENTGVQNGEFGEQMDENIVIGENDTHQLVDIPNPGIGDIVQKNSLTDELNEDELGMEDELDEIISETELKEHHTHLRYPVPISSRLTKIYHQRQIKRRRILESSIQLSNQATPIQFAPIQGEFKQTSLEQIPIIEYNINNTIESSIQFELPETKQEEKSETIVNSVETNANNNVTNNLEQTKLINTWLPFIDVLVSNRHEIFSLIHKKLLKHFEQIVSDGPIFGNSKSFMGNTSLDSSTLNTSGIGSSIPSTTKIHTKVSDSQLMNLFEYLLPFFHNANMKPIWRIVLLEMKKRDVIIPTKILFQLQLSKSIWNEDPKFSRGSSIYDQYKANLDCIQQDLAIRSYFWRIYPKLFIEYLNKDDNMLDLDSLCLYVDHIVLYNYLLSEWRKKFERNPESRDKISLLRRKIFKIAAYNTCSPFVKNLKDTIERFDPLFSLSKIINTWIMQHDTMLIEFGNREFNRLINVLRQLSQFFESVLKREKIWKDISIIFSESNLQNIILKDLYSYIFNVYGNNESKQGSVAGKYRRGNEPAQKSTIIPQNPQIPQMKSFAALLQDQPKLSFQSFISQRDHHENVLIILSQAMLLGENSIHILRKECLRSAPIVNQSYVSEAFSYIPQLYSSTWKGDESPTTIEDPIDIDQGIELRSSKRIGIFYSDSLLRKLILKLSIQLFQEREYDKFQYLIKFFFHQDIAFQEKVITEDFQVFVKPLIEICISHWKTLEESKLDLDSSLINYFVKPIIFPLIRKILSPIGEKRPSESELLTGIDHIFKQDETWLLNHFIELVASFVQFIKEQNLEKSSSYKILLEEIVNFMYRILSGGLENLFKVAKWSSKMDLMKELEKYVLNS